MDVIPLVFGASAIVVGLALMGRLVVLSRANAAAAAGEDPRISDDISVAPPAGLTVIIPARNEEASIGNLLSDLERLDDQSFVDRSSWRIIVVDDQSTDRTAEIVAGFTEVELVATSSLPAGWSGKNWACHSGVQVALSTAEPDSLLLFLDSDVRLSPGAVDAAISRWMPTGGVSSVQPYHRVPTAVEQLSAVFNLVSMMAIGAGTDHPHGMFGAGGPVSGPRLPRRGGSRVGSRCGDRGRRAGTPLHRCGNSGLGRGGGRPHRVPDVPTRASSAHRGLDQEHGLRVDVGAVVADSRRGVGG